MKNTNTVKRLSIILLILMLISQLSACFESKDFEFGEVIIVLTPEESAKNITYTPEDFAYVGCIDIRELTSANKPQRMLVLYIEDNSATGVQHAVEILKSKKGIESATVNAFVSMD